MRLLVLCLELVQGVDQVDDLTWSKIRSMILPGVRSSPRASSDDPYLGRMGQTWRQHWTLPADLLLQLYGVWRGRLEVGVLGGISTFLAYIDLGAS